MEIINPEFIASTAVGGGAVWAVTKVYLKFIMRDVDEIRATQKEHGERIVKVEGAISGVRSESNSGAVRCGGGS